MGERRCTCDFEMYNEKPLPVPENLIFRRIKPTITDLKCHDKYDTKSNSCETFSRTRRIRQVRITDDPRTAKLFYRGRFPVLRRVATYKSAIWWGGITSRERNRNKTGKPEKERGKEGERERKEKRRKKELVDDKRCKHATVYAFFFFFGHRRSRVLIAIFWRRHTSHSPRRPPFPSDNDDSATFESRPGG